MGTEIKQKYKTMSNNPEQYNWSALIMNEYNKDPKRFQKEYFMKPDQEVIKNLEARRDVDEEWVSRIINACRSQFKYDHQDAKIEHVNLDLYFDENDKQWRARLQIEYISL